MEHAPAPARAMRRISRARPAVILIVEDGEQLRRTTRRLLERAGHTVVEARDAEEALRRCGELDGAVDLLLIDVVLGGMSGPGLAGIVRGAWPEARLLFTSGYDVATLSGLFGSALAAPVLEKPFRLEQLLDAIDDVLRDG